VKKTSTENSKTGKISIVGLGKLGACTLVALASKGFEVIGIDINKDAVDKINKGIPPIYEPVLEPLLKLYKDRIKATIHHEEIKETDMTIFIVPTPSLPDGSFSTEYLEAAILETGRCLPDSKKYHNFVVTSTVLPGDMETKIKPLLEQCTNKTVGKELGLCYNPDFIALGNVINGLLSPGMVLIGESDKRAGDMVEQMHIRLTGVEITDKLSVSQTPIHRMSLYNAELAKISLNAYVTMKISFANTITQICGKMPTGDAEKVLNAIGDDNRIGKKCLKPGLSFGGPCFPRDNKAFLHLLYPRPALSQATDTVNDMHIDYVAQILKDLTEEYHTDKISVLGLTYKPDTNITEESAAIRIIKKLDKLKRIDVYDPSMPPVELPKNVAYCVTPEECINNHKICFIATPWKQFKEIYFKRAMWKNPAILDAWGLLPHLADDPDIDYRRLGKNAKT